MCDCGEKIVNYSHLKIYTFMAKYKAIKSSGTLYKGDFKIKWATATQEELSYAYEDLGLTKLVEKLSTIKTNNEPKKESKRSGKTKSSDSKE
tara:strand:- start:440 stop:715 length:276 start_codon:yes stop_codon:yes gene_type:complete